MRDIPVYSLCTVSDIVMNINVNKASRGHEDIDPSS